METKKKRNNQKKVLIIFFTNKIFFICRELSNKIKTKRRISNHTTF